MFTGIIMEIGKVHGICRSGDIYRLEIEASDISKNVRKGDSVAINGVCLTVVGIKKSVLVFDVMKETMDKTTLSALKSGDKVNAEGSLRVGDQLGGHFVLGHVDCVGKIATIAKTAKEVSFTIEVPNRFSDLLVPKGSAAIDGISLTVGEADGGRFTVYIIPHTLAATTLGAKKAGDKVNIEFDILGKYVLRGQQLNQSSKISDAFLKAKGFS